MVEGEPPPEAKAPVPLVAHEVAEVVAGLSAFEEYVPRDAPKEFLAEFGLQEERLVAVKVVLLDSTEPLEPVGSGKLVEGGASSYALPKQTDGHGCVPYKFRISADVQFLLGVAVVAETFVVKVVSPLDQVAVACPVGVVAGVERKVVAYAVAPAVRILGLFDVSVVCLEFDARVVDFDIGAVFECREPLACAEVRFDESLYVKRLSVEFAEFVVVGIVACTEVVADPVFIVDVDVGCEAVP